jgi:hypothetical protein
MTAKEPEMPQVERASAQCATGNVKYAEIAKSKQI